MPVSVAFASLVKAIVTYCYSSFIHALSMALGWTCTGVEE